MFFYIACSTNKTLQVLDLPGNQIGDAGAASIGGALTYVQSRHPKIFTFWGQYIRFFFTFCSQNTSLMRLNLNWNQIDDVGASGISTGLAYVSVAPVDELSFICHATRFFLFVYWGNIL